MPKYSFFQSVQLSGFSMFPSFSTNNDPVGKRVIHSSEHGASISIEKNLQK